MQTIQANQTDLQSLLDEVEKGHSVLIERDGQTVAEIHPERGIDRNAVHKAMQDILEIRKRTKHISIEQILADKREGRR